MGRQAGTQKCLGETPPRVGKKKPDLSTRHCHWRWVLEDSSEFDGTVAAQPTRQVPSVTRMVTPLVASGGRSGAGFAYLLRNRFLQLCVCFIFKAFIFPAK